MPLLLDTKKAEILQSFKTLISGEGFIGFLRDLYPQDSKFGLTTSHSDAQENNVLISR